MCRRCGSSMETAASIYLLRLHTLVRGGRAGTGTASFYRTRDRSGEPIIEPVWTARRLWCVGQVLLDQSVCLRRRSVRRCLFVPGFGIPDYISGIPKSGQSNSERLSASAPSSGKEPSARAVRPGHSAIVIGVPVPGRGAVPPAQASLREARWLI